MKRTSLDGEWRLEYFPQPANGAIRSLPLGVATECVAAQVPGNCELDLAAPACCRRRSAG